jgi:hypothetical protein
MSNLTYTDDAANAVLAKEMIAALVSQDGHRVDAAEAAILKHLQRTGQLECTMSHVEYGCVEHGTVHVCSWDEATNITSWLEVDPTTGKATKL